MLLHDLLWPLDGQSIAAIACGTLARRPSHAVRFGRRPRPGTLAPTAASAAPARPARHDLPASRNPPGQSVELPGQLHILTRDGKLNQDSRRKLKQNHHLYQFIEPAAEAGWPSAPTSSWPTTAPARSYHLGFILYDLFWAKSAAASTASRPATSW